MDGPEFIITLVVIGCIFSLIKTWLNQRKQEDGVDKETFNRLAQAFIQYKKEMQQRVENLETIITDLEENDQYPQIEEPHHNSGLTNDLRQKEKVQ